MASTHQKKDASSLPVLSRHEGRYRNHATMKPASLLRTLRIFWDQAFNKPKDTRPAGEIPVQPLSRQQLLAAPNNTVYRLGHSTVLLKLRDQFWLTDPVFAERASPVQWAGPQRFHQPPISLEDLPPIKAVILSHNHYDHLDRMAIKALTDKTEHFLAPLGVGDTLIEWGVPAHKVRQLDWWQSTEVAGIEFVATPSQHFSADDFLALPLTFADNPGVGHRARIGTCQWTRQREAGDIFATCQTWQVMVALFVGAVMQQQFCRAEGVGHHHGGGQVAAAGGQFHGHLRVGVGREALATEFFRNDQGKEPVLFHVRPGFRRQVHGLT